VKFLELVLENFGPYIGKQIIDLRPETHSKNQPIILFGGMNGGGKTTLMDAIRLALYGSRAQCSTRGNLSYGDFLTQCVNRQTKPHENTRIELAFEHIIGNDLVEYRIVRTWVKNPKDGKDTLGILEPGALDTDWNNEGLTNTWDEYIEKLLPLGISNLFLFDGEQVKELAELEAPPPVVHEAIQTLLGLELPVRLAADLEILVQRKRKQLASAKQLANLEEIEQKLKTQQRDWAAATEKLEALKKQCDHAQTQQQRAADKFLSEGGKIAAERSQLDRELDMAKERATQMRHNLRELAANALPLGLIQPLLHQIQAQGEQERKIARSKIVRDVMIERDRRLLDYLCQLKLPATKTDKINAFLAAENQALDISDEPSILEMDDEILDRLQFILKHELPAQIELETENRTNLEKIELEVDAKERRINAAAPPEVYEKLKNAVVETQKKRAQIQAQYEAAKRDQEEVERTREKTQKELSRYGEQTLDLKNANHILQASAKVRETLKLFREKLTLKKLNKLEIEITECFRYLLHKSDLVHRIAIDAHNFRLSLYDLQGQPVPKHRLSAGEKQLLAIAFLWGLARVSGHQLPVAIDTPLGRLDSSHRQNLVERYFPAASHQVILLSTDTEIGETEYQKLQEQEAIARSYLLKYNSKQQQTTVQAGYFWQNEKSSTQ
jgi:DNA sulfur modification protein DndD